MKAIRPAALAMIFLLFATCLTHAEPSTLYKAADITRARGNMARHRWARDIVDGWKRSVIDIMQRDPAFIDEMISEMSMWPTYGQNCPHCVGTLSSMGETNIYRWSVNDPDRLVCKHCGTIYPNENYPETGSMTAPQMGQTFTFYLTEEERAHPEDSSGKHSMRWASWPVHTSFSGLIRYYKTAWCIGKILPLAKLYAVTGEVEYAARSALIMDIMARRYPNWMYHSYNGTYADCPPGEAASNMGDYPPAGRFPIETIITAYPGLHTKGEHAVLNNGFWGAGRYGCSGSDGGHILTVTVAWDLIRDAQYADGSPVLTPNMNERIVRDLIIAGCDDSENWPQINNKCGPGRALSGAVAILFERPESAHRALEGFEVLLDHSFHFDGFCRESPSYSAMHLNLMRNIPEILAGYSDPAGYKPKDGRRLTNYNPFRESDRYRLALESMVRMLDPVNKYPVIGDTHNRGGLDPMYAEILTDRYSPDYAGLLEEAQAAPLAEKGSEYALWHRDPDLKAPGDVDLPRRSEWFPGWHVGVLRGGDAASHTALYLNGYEHGGHRHYDTLGLIYTAHGQEVASDRGYIWDDPRNAWTKSSMSHNLVVVDGLTQNAKPCNSTLELFGAGEGVEMVQASATAYEQCDEYRRTTALVQLPGGGTYAVDFFRVSGGSKHQYCYNSNGRLISVTGGNPAPVSDEIKWLDNLRGFKPDGPVTATWETNGVRLDLMMLNDVDRFLITDAPGWRSDRGDELNAPPIQQIIAERTGDPGLESRYAVVISPYEGETSPIKAARLIADGSGDGVMAVEVDIEGRTDLIVSAPKNVHSTIQHLKVSGGFIFSKGAPLSSTRQSFSLHRGDHWRGDDVRSAINMDVAAVDGRTFTLTEALPAGIDYVGNYVLGAGTGWEIESAAGRNITVRDYPVVPCEKVTVLIALR